MDLGSAFCLHLPDHTSKEMFYKEIADIFVMDEGVID